MTKTTHTPGPWSASGKTVYGGTGARITVADTTCCGSLTREEDEANARLIAAAPELLEALRRAVERTECYAEWLSRQIVASRPLTDNEREIMSDIRSNLPKWRAAIAKATGEA